MRTTLHSEAASNRVSPTQLHLIGDDGDIAAPSEIARFLAASLGADPRSLPRNFGHAAASNESVPSIPELKKRGTNYRVVGVFGGQSSGKSTLLNHLFNTQFQTMDEDEGRHQTTKGCFLSKAQSADAGPLFVMDFEGTDGVERGENQSFERQLSLFALSVADTLIVNMWANEVGRFNAANLSLLQTVFEVNLQLIAHEDRGAGKPGAADAKPTLLFVLRDHTAGTKSKLAEVVTASLEKIWERIAKPSMFRDARVSDVFVLQFRTLPHYVLQRNEFDVEVRELRRSFLDSSHSDYLYGHAPAGNFRSIPLDGVAPYLQACWLSIKSQKDLDIPTQREMLARLRCDELADALLAAHAAEMDKKLMHIKSHGRLVPNITGWARAAIQERLAEFDADTEHYAERVVHEQKTELEKALQRAADVVVTVQCTKIAEALVRTCDGKVQSVMNLAQNSAIPRLAREWFAKIHDARQEMIRKCRESGEEPSVALERARDAQARIPVSKSVMKFWDFVSEEIAEVVTELRDSIRDCCDPSAPAGVDGETTEVDASRTTSEDEQRIRLLSCLNGDESATDRTLIQLTRGMQQRIASRLETITADPCGAMVKTFEKLLNQNEDGTTRFLTTLKGLDRVFGPARAAGLLLLACVTVNRLTIESGDDVDGTDDEQDDEVSRQRRVLKAVERWQREACHLEFAADESHLALIGAPIYPQMPVVADRLSPDETDMLTAAKAATADLVLLTQVSVDQAYMLYRQNCEFKYQMQVKVIEASQQNVPAWMWGLLLLFGFNDILWLLSNPLLLLLVVFTAYFFFSNWVVAQWHRFEEAGPQAVVVPVKTALALVQAQYHQHVGPLISHRRTGSQSVEAQSGTTSRAASSADLRKKLD
jgi:hypothetical protein